MKLAEYATLAKLDLDDIWERWLQLSALREGHHAEVHLNTRKQPAPIPVGYYIAIGFNHVMQEHACVYLDGKLVHDPWPDPAYAQGLVKITKIVVLVPNYLASRGSLPADLD